MRYGVWAPIPQWVGGTVKWGDRYGTRPRAIVIHRMEGSLEGSDSYLRRERADYAPYPRLNASTHFGVGLWNGVSQIRQWVDTMYSAFGWAATPTDVPTALARTIFKDKLTGQATWPYWRSTSDLNRDVICIEVEGFADQPWHPLTTPRVKELINVLVNTYGPLWVMVHTDCSTKPCPGMATFKAAMPGYYGTLWGAPTGDGPTAEEIEMAILPYIISKQGRWFDVAANVTLRKGPGVKYPPHFKTEHPSRFWLHGFVHSEDGWVFASRSPTSKGFFFVPPAH